MATVQDIGRRIRSVTNTRKITRAMELVAAAKLRRAQTRIEAMRPYAERMQELMVGTARASSSVRGLPLLQRREINRAAIVPLTGDRGLAGAFNAQVLREAFALERELRAEGTDVRWLVAGKKGTSSLRFRRYELVQSWAGFSDNPQYFDAQAIANRLAELYSEQEVDQVFVIYNAFESALVQRVTRQEVLPIPEQVLESGDDDHSEAMLGDFIYEPEPEQILERLLPGLRRDRALPRAPRVRSLRAGRAHDGHAQRLEERGRAHRAADAANEPRPPGGDHPGDPGSRRRRRRTNSVAPPASKQLRGTAV